MEKNQLIKKFDKQSVKYAKRRKKMKGYEVRAKMFKLAKGKTLEVAVGAGANFHFFPKDIEYIGVDFSSKMIEEAKISAKENNIKAEFIEADVESLNFPDNSFDTIVSTGSLCGYENPIDVLNLFNKWCKEDGQILLVEHGLSSISTVAWIQNRVDKLSVKIAGCHQNRDMLDIVNQSNLIIDKHERALMKSLYLIWARPEK